MIVDVHSHILPEQAAIRMQRESAEHAPYILDPTDDGGTVVMGPVRYEGYRRGGWDIDRRVGELDVRGIDVQVISPIPFTYGYDLEPELGIAFAQIQNEEIAVLVHQHPRRFVGLGTVPLQAPEAAARELRRSMGELRLRGAIVGTHVRGANLNDPSLEPFWEAAQAAGAFLFLHPWSVAGAERLKDFYLSNVVGNPFETTVAVASLVLGGVLERYPDLTICLPHGGGSVPYQRGRLEHAWRAQPQARQVLRTPPGPLLDRLYLDTILFAPAPLEFLIRTAGADRVLLGSDFPFGMGEEDPRGFVESVPLDDAARRLILGETAARLLRLPPAARSSST